VACQGAQAERVEGRRRGLPGKTLPMQRPGRLRFTRLDTVEAREVPLYMRPPYPPRGEGENLPTLICTEKAVCSTKRERRKATLPSSWGVGRGGQFY